ncbi:MAG: sugar phosphate nucleotidyltransferase [bacterium]
MKPALVVLAAGIGSRYGGIKQLDKIGPFGETIVDYSIYDAVQAGFEKVIFIIKESIEQDFKEIFVEKLQDQVTVDYVFQELWMVPDGMMVPDTRQKPWGTGHALLMAAEKVHGPFAVINSDDFYGRKAYKALADYYFNWKETEMNKYCMVGYRIKNTVSDFGFVSRGICQTDNESNLVDVVERTHIERLKTGIAYKEDDKFVAVDENSIVSMNFWGFTPSFFEYLRIGFEAFLKNNLENPKAEFYIPTVVNELIKSGKGNVKVIDCQERWFGMTYKEDREIVVKGIRKLIEKGVYPEKLWG